MKIDRKDYEKTLPILAKKIEELEKKINSGATISLSTLGVIATATELNFVKGVKSSIQTQLDGKVPTSRTINGKALTGNIKLSASDVGASASDHNHDTIYAKIDHTHTGYATSNHNHDTVYSKLDHTHSGYATSNHNHDTVYSKLGHNHDGVYAPATHSHSYLPIAGGTITGALTANTVTSDSTMTSKGKFEAKNNIEVYGSTPYVDFHFGNSTADNTSRIIENQSGTLSVNGVYCSKTGKLKSADLTVTGTTIICKPTRETTTTYATNMYVGETGTYYRTTNTSSRTIKHDIKTLSNDDLNAEHLYDLEVVQFKYNEGIITDTDDSRYDATLPGFIIENMNEVYPIAVDKPTDNVKEWSWNTQYLIPPMLKLIQEQHKELEQLKKEVQILKG